MKEKNDGINEYSEDISKGIKCLQVPARSRTVQNLPGLPILSIQTDRLDKTYPSVTPAVTNDHREK